MTRRGKEGRITGYTVYRVVGTGEEVRVPIRENPQRPTRKKRTRTATYQSTVSDFTGNLSKQRGGRGLPSQAVLVAENAEIRTIGDRRSHLRAYAQHEFAAECVDLGATGGDEDDQRKRRGPFEYTTRERVTLYRDGRHTTLCQGALFKTLRRWVTEIDND